MSDERVLLDATFIAGYLDARDQHHLQTQKCIPRVEAAREVIITEAVLVEVGNLLHATLHGERAAQLIEACYTTANITVVPVNSELLMGGIRSCAAEAGATIRRKAKTA